MILLTKLHSHRICTQLNSDPIPEITRIERHTPTRACPLSKYWHSCSTHINVKFTAKPSWLTAAEKTALDSPIVQSQNHSSFCFLKYLPYLKHANKNYILLHLKHNKVFVGQYELNLNSHNKF
jgi:hypothetical protein